MKITKRQLRRIIREEVLREAGDDISNADLAKGMKAGAADMAAAIPAKLNDDFAAAVKGLAALAKFDKSKFDKMKGYIAKAAEPALEKSNKGNEEIEKEKT